MNKELIMYHFEEFIKALITLSLSAEKQIHIIGIGHTGDEMVIDFDTFYRDHIDSYIKEGLISTKQAVLLEAFDNFLEVQSLNQPPEFFLDRKILKESQVWEDIRIETKKLLRALNRADWDIRVHRRVDGNVEHTKTEIIKKDIT
ncbi:hypothetical protein [Paenibacillus senegalimassiliensis]|uniref:hypothetical protein n=1 Tax=Paenibacillus senegalimassiliensis TaxID=1737426 RepID=UPI00073E71FC|nr:hypothetical protein [Paenibacillus senegalimassiliensis]